MITWDETFATGEKTIDAQHKTLFKFINDLNDSIKEGKPAENLKDRIAFLMNYAKTHFGYEENCMHQYRCPVAQKNKDAHKDFVEYINNFEKKLDKDGYTPESVADLHFFIEFWLVQHIRGIDTKLRPCVAAKTL